MKIVESIKKFFKLLFGNEKSETIAIPEEENLAIEDKSQTLGQDSIMVENDTKNNVKTYIEETLEALKIKAVVISEMYPDDGKRIADEAEKLLKEYLEEKEQYESAATSNKLVLALNPDSNTVLYGKVGSLEYETNELYRSSRLEAETMRFKRMSERMDVLLKAILKHKYDSDLQVIENCIREAREKFLEINSMEEAKFNDTQKKEEWKKYYYEVKYKILKADIYFHNATNVENISRSFEDDSEIVKNIVSDLNRIEKFNEILSAAEEFLDRQRLINRLQMFDYQNSQIEAIKTDRFWGLMQQVEEEVFMTLKEKNRQEYDKYFM